MSSLKTLFAADEAKRIFGNISWMMGEKVLQFTLGFLVISLTARYLGPESFGRYSYALSFALLFAPLANLGLSGILVQRLVARPEEESATLGTAFTLQAGGAILCVLLALGSIYALRGSTDESIVWTVMALTMLLFKPFDTLDSYFQAHLKSQYIAIAKIIALVALAAATLTGIALGWSGAAFVLIKGLSFGVIALAMAGLYRRYSQGAMSAWRYSGQQAKSLLKQSWPLILSGATAAVYMKIDQVMLGEIADDRTVGIYAAAVQISELWYFLPWIIVSAFFPSLIRSKTGTDYDSRLLWLYKLMAILAMSLCICVMIFADLVIDLVFGQKYAEAADILRIHTWASLFIFMRVVLSRWMIIEELTVFSFVTHGLGALINVALNFALIPEYGASGAAVATVFSYAVASYFSLFFHGKTSQPRAMMLQALLFALMPWRWPKLFWSAAR